MSATCTDPVTMLPVCWPRETFQAPAAGPAPGFSEAGVEAVFYDGLPWHGQPTRVFAWVGYPDTPAGETCPGMVLVHGGGGTGFAAWVRLWTARGYAAIAMDTCGCIPRGEYANWQRHPDGGPPGWGASWEQMDDAVEDQWPWHAVGAAMLGHSLLAADPRVDGARVGLTGISWGGWLTCLLAAADPRFRFAAPVYGCGFLGENSTWIDTVFPNYPAPDIERWLAQWDPRHYLPHVRSPMLWVTGTNDFAYPMDSVQKSYRLPPTPRILAIRNDMPHGHHGPGENPPEIHAVAESVLRNRSPLACVGVPELDGDRLRARFGAGRPVVSADLLVTRALGHWSDRKWRPYATELDADTGTVSAVLPARATAAFINLVDDRDCVVSTEHVVVG